MYIYFAAQHFDPYSTRIAISLQYFSIPFTVGAMPREVSTKSSIFIIFWKICTLTNCVTVVDAYYQSPENFVPSSRCSVSKSIKIIRLWSSVGSPPIIYLHIWRESFLVYYFHTLDVLPLVGSAHEMVTLSPIQNRQYTQTLLGLSIPILLRDVTIKLSIVFGTTRVTDILQHK